MLIVYSDGLVPSKSWFSCWAWNPYEIAFGTTKTMLKPDLPCKRSHQNEVLDVSCTSLVFLCCLPVSLFFCQLPRCFIILMSMWKKFVLSWTLCCCIGFSTLRQYNRVSMVSRLKLMPLVRVDCGVIFLTAVEGVNCVDCVILLCCYFVVACSFINLTLIIHRC